MVLKKALKILLGLAIVNAVVSWLISLIYGESRILSFIPISGGYDVRGIFAGTFFFAIILVVYLVVYAVLPKAVIWVREKFSIALKMHKTIAGLFGQRAKEDAETDFSVYLKKITSSLVILIGIMIIPINFLMMSQTQNQWVIGGFFVLVILMFFLITRKIYALFSE